MKTTHILAAALLAATLAGCGGGGSDPAPMTPPLATDPNVVPASATASTAAYVSFTASLAASDTQEPLDVSTTTPPTSETEEPVPLS